MSCTEPGSVLRDLATRAGALVLTAMSSAALAQVSSPPGATLLDALDGDQDGFVSFIEAQSDQDVARRFTLADKNKDGRLSRAELDAAFRSRPPSTIEPTQPRPPQP